MKDPLAYMPGAMVAVALLALAVVCCGEVPEPEACTEGLWCDCPALGAAYPGHTTCEPDAGCDCMECTPDEERTTVCDGHEVWERCGEDGTWRTWCDE